MLAWYPWRPGNSTLSPGTRVYESPNVLETELSTYARISNDPNH